MSKKILFVFGTMLLVASTARLQATQPEVWTVSTQDEFLKGDLKGVSVSSDGKLVLAPALQPLYDTGQAYIYSAVTDQRGNLYLGTGNEGRIFRVTPDGQGKEFAKVGESGVYALAVDSNGRLYAGTSPDGKVYRFNSEGQPEVFFDPEEKYIWSLAIDSQNNVFVGTGPKGVIYRVDPLGKGEAYYDANDTHVISLKEAPDGALLAGTAPSGLILRISRDKKPYVLYDSPLEEIRAIAVDRYGNVYAAALSGGGSLDQKAAQAAASVSSRVDGSDDSSQSDNESTVKISGTEKGKKLQVYEIDKENMVETLYTSDDQLAFDLLVRDDGSLLVATGNKGRILSISPERFVTYLAQSPEEQVTRLLERRGKIVAVTSNLGKVFEMQSQFTNEGVYESKVLDAGMIASWGVIRWNLNQPTSAVLKVYTRSGNTKTPDSTWSSWAGPYDNRNGSPIQSQAARYLQWKIEFPAGARSSLSSQENAVELVGVSYLQHNMAPSVTSVTVLPPGVAFAESPSSGSSGGVALGGPEGAHLGSLPRDLRSLEKTSIKVPPRRIYVPGARSVSWDADDPNNDDLTYSVYLRGENDRDWKLLAKDLKDTNYTLDGVSFADGTYFAKIVASDQPSNPAASALQGELVSNAFVIANSSPGISFGSPQVTGNKAVVTFQAQVQASTVFQAEYALDGGDWQVVFPQDGIADSPSEQYSLTLDHLTAGEHSLAVRVVDSVGNIATSQLTITAK